MVNLKVYKACIKVEMNTEFAILALYKARFFLLVDLREFLFRPREGGGGDEKKNK